MNSTKDSLVNGAGDNLHINIADVENSTGEISTTTPVVGALDLLEKSEKPAAITMQIPSTGTADDTIAMTSSSCNSGDSSSDEESHSGNNESLNEGSSKPLSDAQESPRKENRPLGRAHCCSVSNVVQRWVFLMDFLRKCITRGVLCITNHAAKNPYSYAIGIPLLSLGLLGTGFATNFDMTVAAHDSLTGKTSIIRDRKDWVDHISGFPSPPLSIRMMLHAQGISVLTHEAVRHAFQVVHKVETTPGYDTICTDELSKKHYNQKHTGYVGGFSSKCHIRGVTMLWNNSRDIMEDQVNSNDDVTSAVTVTKFPDGSDMDIREIMGKASLREGDVIAAESLLLEFIIPSAHAKSASLETAVLERLIQLRNEWSNDLSTSIELEVFTYLSLEQESTRAVMKDIPLIAIVFVVMALFTCAVFSSRDTSNGIGKFEYASTSHTLLGLGAVVCIVLSLASSYGILYIIGVPFTSLTQILPFVMMGIGLDDSFIIFGEYKRTDATKNPVERIQDTFEEIGLSIVLTKITTTIAFALGCSSNIPTISWLSLYAFPTVLVDFAYQITYFVALVVLDDRRIRKGRRYCCRCLAMATNTEEIGDQIVNSISPETSILSYAPSSYTTNKATTRTPKQQRSRIDRFMGWYSDQLLRPKVKLTILTLFLATTAAFAYSTTLFTQEFDLSAILPKDSFVRDYLSAMTSHGDRGFVISSAYFRDVDQSDPEVQLQMENYVDNIVGMNSVSEQPPFFWLRHFRLFLAAEKRLLDMTFNQQVDLFLAIKEFRLLYGDHIIRDPETLDIVASRCVIYMDKVNLNAVANQIAAWEEIENTAAVQPINLPHEEEKFFMYEPDMMYIWEFYSQTVDEFITTTQKGVIAVTTIGFIFIPHWTATLFLFPIMAVLYIGLIGFLQACQVHLNAVSFFALTMSIGLLVDFNMHILLRYYESPYLTRDQKVKDALQTMGSSVLIGGFSTFLGVLPLFFSSSEVMMTLFYGFVGMVALGCSVGLSVLPIILSMVGPLDTVGRRSKTSLSVNFATPGSLSPILPSKRLARWDREGSIYPNASRTVSRLSEKRMEATLIALYSEHNHWREKTTLMLPVATEYGCQRLDLLKSEESSSIDQAEKSCLLGQTSLLNCRQNRNMKEGQLRPGQGECKAPAIASKQLIQTTEEPNLCEPSPPAASQNETTKEDQLRPNDSKECTTIYASCSSLATLENRDSIDTYGPKDGPVLQPAVIAEDENTDAEDDESSFGSKSVPTMSYLNNSNPNDGNIFEERNGRTSVLDPIAGQRMQAIAFTEDSSIYLEEDSSLVNTEPVLAMAQSVDSTDDEILEESSGEASWNCERGTKERPELWSRRSAHTS